MVGREGRRRPGGTRALVVDAVAARLRQLAEEAHCLGREAAPHLGDEHENLVPALERLLDSWYLAVRAGAPAGRGGTTSGGAKSPRFSASSRARVAPKPEGLGRTWVAPRSSWAASETMVL